MALLAGVARADVTPPVGVMMSGYAARKTPSVGVHDDLAATALYLEKDGVQAGLVSLDLIDVETRELDELRARCQELAGVLGENVFVACSHTHGGPLTEPREGDKLLAAYLENTWWKIAGALSEAKRNAAPVRLGHARTEARVAGNRRERTPDGRTILGFNPNLPSPRVTDVLRLDRADTGQPMAVLFQYGCHGTTMGGDNYLITADYQGSARRFVERGLAGARAMFVGGCAGNQNPHPRGTFALAEQHGQRLGAAVVHAALSIEATREVERLKVHALHHRLPLAELPTIQACRDELTAAEAAAEAERQRAREKAQQAGVPCDPKIPLAWATERRLKRAQECLAAVERGEKDLFIPVELQALALDDVALVSLPGEIFFEIGEEIRRRSPFRVTLPVDYANGSIGYVPTQAEVPFGGYEVQMSRAHRHGLPLRDDADAALIAGALAALAQAR